MKRALAATKPGQSGYVQSARDRVSIMTLRLRLSWKQLDDLFGILKIDIMTPRPGTLGNRVLHVRLGLRWYSHGRGRPANGSALRQLETSCNAWVGPASLSRLIAITLGPVAAVEARCCSARRGTTTSFVTDLYRPAKSGSAGSAGRQFALRQPWCLEPA